MTGNKILFAHFLTKRSLDTLYQIYQVTGTLICLLFDTLELAKILEKKMEKGKRCFLNKQYSWMVKVSITVCDKFNPQLSHDWKK